MAFCVYVCVGEYFLSQEEKRERAAAAQAARQSQRTEERLQRRAAAFVAPEVGHSIQYSITRWQVIAHSPLHWKQSSTLCSQHQTLHGFVVRRAC